MMTATQKQRDRYRQIAADLSAAEAKIAPQIKALERPAVAPLRRKMETLQEKIGETFASCESCGCPFFEGDLYATGDEDGCSVCWPAADRPDAGPCYGGKGGG